MEIAFPFDFVVVGVPVSLQAKRPETREAWKARVREAAQANIFEAHFATQAPMTITIYYFLDDVMEGDLDNIIKPIVAGRHRAQ